MSAPLQLNDLPPDLPGRSFGTSQLRISWGSSWSVRLLVSLVDLLTRSPIKVDRTFHDVVADQPYLQYQCEFAATGLLDNPDAPRTFFDRRTGLHKYRSKFGGLKPTSKSSLPLGVAVYCCGYDTSGDVYVLHATSTNTLHFCRPPRRRRVGRWERGVCRCRSGLDALWLIPR